MGAEVRSLYVVLSANATAFRGQMVAAGSSARAFGAQVLAMSDESERALQRLGSGAGRAGAAAAGALLLMGKAALDWESSWAGVSKTVDGSAAEMQELEDQLRGLARTLPATHDEIAAVAEAAGQLGVAREDIATFTRTMIDLGETTNLSADQAATAIAQMANVMGTAPEDVSRVGAALVALGNDGASTEAQILEMAQRIAGAGAQIGLTEADILAVANAAASMGIEAEAGGSSISRIFTDMAKATSQGGDSLQQFADIAGMTSAQFVSAFEDDPTRAFASFTAGLDEMSKAGGDVFTALDQLGLSDIRVSQALLSMAASGDLLTDSLDLGAQAWQENTALTDEAAKRYETTGAQAQVAWNQIKDAGIEAGDSLLPVIAQIASGVGDVAEAFGELPAPVQGALTKLLAITAVTGGGLWFGSKVISGISDTKAALAQLGVEAGTTRAMLSRIGKGLELAAIGLSIQFIGDELDRLFDANLEGDINRNLEALSNGEVTGNLDKMGEAIADFSSDWERNWGKVNTKMPFTTSDWEKAEEKISAVDEALAAMVESGNVEMAAAVFEQLVGMAEKEGASAADTAAAFDQYALALDNLIASKGLAAGGPSDGIWAAFYADADAAGDAASATDGYADAAGAAAAAAAEEANAIRDSVKAMREKRNATLEAFDAETQWRSALRAAREQAAKTSAGIRGSSEAALENRQQLSGLAAAWNNQSAAVKNNRGRFREARSAFIETAEAMGVGERAARRLADKILEIPKSRVVDIEARADQALRAAEQVRAKLDALRDRTITLRVRRLGEAGIGPLRGGDGLADGGLVRGPGGPREDRIPAMLSNGEYVVNAAATSLYRPLLDTINSGRSGARVHRSASRAAVARSDRLVDGGRTVIVERTVRQVLPDRLQLVVDGHHFTAYVRGQAVDVVSGARSSDASRGRMDWP